MDSFRDGHRYKQMLVTLETRCLVLTTAEIMDFAGLDDLACVNVMIMLLMIMIIGIVEMTVGREIMITEGIVMILIMIEAEGMTVGSGVVHVTENVRGEI